jgi:hypothetical protein
MFNALKKTNVDLLFNCTVLAAVHVQAKAFSE